MAIVFYFLSALTLGTALMTVLSRNPIYSAIYMIICFFSIAGHYLLLDAQFLAIVHVIVYTGSVMILLLFTLMLMNLNETHERRKITIGRITAVVAACLMGLVLFAALIKAIPEMESYKATGVDYQSVKVLGNVLFTEYLLPFEFASVMLLVAMIGAVMISKKKFNS
ncbi:NADH-quinone oxidoreductase subunit J [Proteiniphilum sp.]|uniref:NADH-quinone oxidoreductase subunit J family protein n=1 Tax=Proteiniphilum sp. TaxID=1926877 RepID=UPI002B2176E5|nr:NADH-quinone oxidoreductase subunit J [Proteiniphilum sp.]MEA4918720.1 NADH-quinone oxidoreductase subunit J [Proteiniphilum sp.]